MNSRTRRLFVLVLAIVICSLLAGWTLGMVLVVLGVSES
jgi:hypothetical protein